MIPPHRIIERMVTQTLLGIRFWDPVTDRQVSDGLHVTGQLLNDVYVPVGRVVVARRVPSGNYTFFGLHKAERAEPDATLWEVIPPRTLALIEVRDTMGRFLPMSFKAPMPFRGPFRGVGDGDWQAHPLILMLPIPDPDQEPDQEEGVYLWSAPNRSVPPGMAVIYAHLVMDTNGGDEKPPPAAYALVKVERLVDAAADTWTEHAYGVADERGMLTLPLPYPASPEQSVNGNAPPLGEQIFRLRMQFFARPGTFVTQPGWNCPDMVGILLQPQAQVLAEIDPQDLRDELEVDLTFQTPVILRTTLANGEYESFLRLTT